jgi:predicted metal-dependent enzyme (double-stranded beta helix superfamily)
MYENNFFSTNFLSSLGLKVHASGYGYLRLTPKQAPILLILIIWPPGITSHAHDHGLAWNLTWLLPIGDEAQLQANLYSVDQGKLEVDRTAVVNKGQFHIVPPYQVHEIANTSQNIAVSLHLYGLGRRR